MFDFTQFFNNTNSNIDWGSSANHLCVSLDSSKSRDWSGRQLASSLKMTGISAITIQQESMM